MKHGKLDENICALSFYFVFELTRERTFEQFSVVRLKEKRFLKFSIFEFKYNAQKLLESSDSGCGKRFQLLFYSIISIFVVVFGLLMTLIFSMYGCFWFINDP